MQNIRDWPLRYTDDLTLDGHIAQSFEHSTDEAVCSPQVAVHHYLSPLDKQVALNKRFVYLRYMNDFVILTRTRTQVYHR